MNRFAMAMVGALWVNVGDCLAVDFGDSTGSIVGRVVFKGKPPAAKVIQVTQDRDVCGRSLEIRTVEVGEGGLMNVVVRLDGIEGVPDPARFPQPVLDQKGCRFVPPVVLMAPGELTVKNSDGILHNVHLYTQANPPVNFAMPRFLRQRKIRLEEPETIRVRCDAHGWMAAYILVAEHPFYALTDSSGAFRIDEVPAGQYRLVAWHETLGEKRTQLKVVPGVETKVEVVYSQK